MKRFPVLTDEEIEQVIAQIQSYPCTPTRKLLMTALFTLLANLGLRVSEALDVRPHDCDFDRAEITIRTLKQRKAKRQAVTSSLWRLFLLGWLSSRQDNAGRDYAAEDTLPLDEATIRALKPVCHGLSPRDRIFPFSRKVAWNIFQRLLHRAGILPVKLHALRHSAVTRWIEAGGVIFARDMARHRNLQTTSMYAHYPTLRERFLSLKAIGKEAPHAD